jgi:hypothetical protein
MCWLSYTKALRFRKNEEGSIFSENMPIRESIKNILRKFCTFLRPKMPFSLENAV